MRIKKLLKIASASIILLGSTILPLNTYTINSKVSLKNNINDDFVVNNNLVNEKKIIAIDPGHDNKYTGCYVRRQREEVLTLDVSKKLEALLSENYNVFLTRVDGSRVNINNLDIKQDNIINVKDELLARTEYIKSKHADYSISLHYNYSPNSKVRGMEIYFYGIINPKELDDGKKNIHLPKDCKIYSEKSMNVAKNLAKYVKSKGIIANVYGCDFRLVRGDSTKVALLVDIGYLSNLNDFKNIASEEGHEATAKLIADFFRDNKTYLDSIVDARKDLVNIPFNSYNLIKPQNLNSTK